MGVREEQLGKRLRALRAQRGWTQAELIEKTRPFFPAGEVGDRVTISRLEHGKQWPRPGTLHALAAAFGVSPAYLVGGDEPFAQGGMSVPLPEPEFTRVLARINELPGPVRERIARLVDDLMDVLDEAGVIAAMRQPGVSQAAPPGLPEGARTGEAQAEEPGFELDEADRELDSLLERSALSDEEREELRSLVGRTRNRRLIK